eukprot:1190126-Prorocentrum_minimum.AAC.15
MLAKHDAQVVYPLGIAGTGIPVTDELLSPISLISPISEIQQEHSFPLPEAKYEVCAGNTCASNSSLGETNRASVQKALLPANLRRDVPLDMSAHMTSLRCKIPTAFRIAHPPPPSHTRIRDDQTAPFDMRAPLLTARRASVVEHAMIGLCGALLPRKHGGIPVVRLDNMEIGGFVGVSRFDGTDLVGESVGGAPRSGQVTGDLGGRGNPKANTI